MLIEKIEGVDLSYKLFETILDAVKIGCITIDQVEQYCYKVEGINAYYTEDHINILSELNILSSGVKIQLKKQSVINNKIKFLQIFLDKLKEDYSIYKFIDVDTI